MCAPRCGTTDLRRLVWWISLVVCVRLNNSMASGSSPGKLSSFYKSFLTNDRTEYSCAVEHVSYLNSLYFPLEIAK